MTPFHRALLTSACFALATGTASAAGPATRHMASKDELRACLDQKDQLAERDQDLQPEQAAVTEALANVKKEQSDLTEQQARLDKKNAGAVKAFNARLTEVDAHIDAANAKADAFNAQQNALHTAQVAYYQSCAQNSYRSWDEDAVAKERAAERQASPQK